MGKCFSAVDQGKRKESDYYPTHYSLTKQLLENEYFNYDLPVLEPACGDDLAIVKILKKNFEYVRHYDLNASDDFIRKDFFSENVKFPYLISNPPYGKLAQEFVIKAKEIATIKFAFLLRMNFLQGVDRYNKIFNVYDDYRLKTIWQFTRMVDMSAPLREDGLYPTAMLSFAWMVWEKGYNGEAELKFIDNQKYVLSKGDCK